MMAPTAMTTSAVSMTKLGDVGFPRDLHHAPHLEDHLERRERGDVPAIERRRHLYDVEPDDTGLGGRAAQQLERLARRESARGRNLRARGKRRVQDVDVERDMDGLACEMLGELLRRPSGVARDLG